MCGRKKKHQAKSHSMHRNHIVFPLIPLTAFVWAETKLPFAMCYLIHNLLILLPLLAQLLHSTHICYHSLETRLELLGYNKYLWIRTAAWQE